MGGRGSSSSGNRAINRVDRGGTGTSGGGSTPSKYDTASDKEVRHIIANGSMHYSADAAMMQAYGARGKLDRQARSNLRDRVDSARWRANHLQAYARKNPDKPLGQEANRIADRDHALAEIGHGILSRPLRAPRM